MQPTEIYWYEFIAYYDCDDCRKYCSSSLFGIQRYLVCILYSLFAVDCPLDPEGTEGSSFAMAHPLFHPCNQPSAQEGHAEIQYGGDGETCERAVCDGDHILGPEHQIRNADHGHDGGFLDHSHKFIAEGGENIPDRLRQYDVHHRLGVAVADAARRLHLAAVHRLNAGAYNLRHIGAAVETHGDDTGGKAAEIRNKGNVRERNADHRQTVKDEHELNHQRGAADELDIRGGDEAQRHKLAHAQHGKQRAQNGGDEHRKGRDDQRVADTLGEKAVIAGEEQ